MLKAKKTILVFQILCASVFVITTYFHFYGQPFEKKIDGKQSNLIYVQVYENIQVLSFLYKFYKDIPVAEYIFNILTEHVQFLQKVDA